MQIAACDGSREVATARDENFGDNPLEGNLLEGVGALPRDDGSAAEDCFSRSGSGQSRLACSSGRPPIAITTCDQAIVASRPRAASAGGRTLVLVSLVDEDERLSQSDRRLVLNGARLGERGSGELSRDQPRSASSHSMAGALEAKYPRERKRSTTSDAAISSARWPNSCLRGTIRFSASGTRVARLR